MTRVAIFHMVCLFSLLLVGSSYAQKLDLKQVVARKWKVIWFSDDGVVKNMEARKQQLIMKSDGTGQMYMMGEKVGDIAWSVVSKNQINFQDDPRVEPYLCKVSKYKKGVNMLFTGKMPTGVVRKVYFEALSGK